MLTLHVESLHAWRVYPKESWRNIFNHIISFHRESEVRRALSNKPLVYMHTCNHKSEISQSVGRETIYA
jgi:hypothetical protein